MELYAFVVFAIASSAFVYSSPSSSHEESGSLECAKQQEASKMKPAIIVHGGAGQVLKKEVERTLAGTRAAAAKGYRVLTQGRSAVDAVQAAICELENDPTFNAGIGSVLTSERDVEMDAAIMDGTTLETGAVAAVKNVKNPIALARMVMINTPHCLLVGQGANKFADEQGLPRLSSDKLITKESRKKWKKFKKSYRKASKSEFSKRDHDTVGAVAIDKDGNIAYGTSTGGLTNKRHGRVGDSPLTGMGGFADSNVAGISCTGHGESIIKVALAYDIVSLMKYANMSTIEAAEEALGQMSNKLEKARKNLSAGIIGIGKDGIPVYSFKTEQMAWAWAKEGKLHNGFYPGDDYIYTVKVVNNEVELSKDD